MATLTFNSSIQDAIRLMNGEIICMNVTKGQVADLMREVKKVYYYAYATAETDIRPIITNALEQSIINAKKEIRRNPQFSNFEMAGVPEMLEIYIERLEKATTTQQYIETLAKIPSSSSTMVEVVNSETAFITHFKQMEVTKQHANILTENEKLKQETSQLQQQITDLQKQNIELLNRMEGMKTTITGLLNFTN